jgi:hypothetical protein
MIQNRPNRRIVKDVGLELGRLAPGDKTVVDIGAQLTFYSGGTMLPLPYAEEPVALRYLAAKKPDFVVTDSAASARHPLRRWGEHGLDDPHAKLLLEKTDTRGRHIRVYRWQNP